MRADNRLTAEFLRTHPAGAARTLEQIPADAAAGFLVAIGQTLAASVLGSMLPGPAAAICRNVGPEQVAAWLAQLAPLNAARLLQTLEAERSNEVMTHLTDRVRAAIQPLLRHRKGTAKSLMDTAYLLLAEPLSVADAIKRIENSTAPVEGEVYVVDREHRLVGVIKLATLFRAGRHLPLNAVMVPRPLGVPADTRIEGLGEHTGWKRYRTLPVTARDGTVLGILRYERLWEAHATGSQTEPPGEALEGMLSVAQVYWSAVTELTDTVFTRPNPRRAGRP